MAKKLVSMLDLKALLLSEVRKHDECQDVTDVGIYRVLDPRSENNWSVSVIGCGSAPADVANRIAMAAQDRLGRLYDLVDETN